MDSSTAVTLPDSPLAVAAIEYALKLESLPVANHSIRAFLFAKLFAAHQGVELDRDVSTDLLLCATVLHDLGLTEPGNREQRFEVDGADLAAEFLSGKGLPGDQVDEVWDAIAFHTLAGIADRKGGITALTHFGTMMDFGGGAEIVPDDVAEAIHQKYPRHQMAKSLADIVVAQAQKKESKAPAYSIAADLVRQRAEGADIVTDLERFEIAHRWGE
jgi:hypothetical protein